jgi:Frataxin-like domain
MLTASPLTTQQYHNVSDHTMDALTEQLERLIEDGGDQLDEWDLEYSVSIHVKRKRSTSGSFFFFGAPSRAS